MSEKISEALKDNRILFMDEKDAIELITECYQKLTVLLGDNLAEVFEVFDLMMRLQQRIADLKKQQ